MWASGQLLFCLCNSVVEVGLFRLPPLVPLSIGRAGSTSCGAQVPTSTSGRQLPHDSQPSLGSRKGRKTEAGNRAGKPLRLRQWRGRQVETVAAVPSCDQLFAKREMRSKKCKVRSAKCEVRSAKCKCKVQSAKCEVRSAKCEVQSAKCKVQGAR